jgi:hypothetical protein
MLIGFVQSAAKKLRDAGRQESGNQGEHGNQEGEAESLGNGFQPGRTHSSSNASIDEEKMRQGTKTELAQRLGISVKRVTSAIERGEIAAKRVGRSDQGHRSRRSARKASAKRFRGTVHR